MKDEVWYFAYGSNLDRKRFIKRVGGFKDVKRAILKGYRISFNSFHPGWGGGVADVVEEEGDEVDGVAYLIEGDKLNKLDRAVGVPNFYRRMRVKVITEEGEIEAYTYTTVRKRKFVAPTPSYLSLVIKGLRQQGWRDKEVEKVKEAAIP